MGGRRAARQGARRGGSRPGRFAGRPARPRVRHGAHRLRPLCVPGAGPCHGCAPGRHRGAGRRGGLRLHPHAQDARDRRAVRTRPAGQGQARHPHRQHGARAASSTRRRWPTPSATASWPGRASTCSPRSRAPSRRSSSCRASWSRRISAPRPRRRRTRPGSRSPSRCCWRSPATSSPTPSTWRPATSPTRCGGFMGLAEQLGRFFVGLHDGLPDAIEIEYQGELAGREHGHPDAVGPQGDLRRLDRGAGLLRQRAAAGRAAGSAVASPPPRRRTTTSRSSRCARARTPSPAR